MTKWAFCLCSALVSLSAVASEASRLELKGLAIGDPADRAVELHRGGDLMVDCFGDQKLGAEYWCYLRHRLVLSGGRVEPGSRVLHYTVGPDGTITDLSMAVPASTFSDLAAAMIQKFGQPDEDKASEVQNRMGATFDQRELSWTREGATMRAGKRGSSVDKGYVRIDPVLTSEQQEAERQERINRAAEAL